MVVSIDYKDIFDLAHTYSFALHLNSPMDSIKFIQIIVSLEEAFECEIPDEKLLLAEMNSVNKMLEVLQLAVSESDKSVIE